jgi:anti-sigma factor RsiW
MTEPHAPGEHLQVNEVTGYLAGTLPATMRDRMERHLADCEECTAEIVAVHRLRRPARSPARWIGAAAAAAAVAGLVLLGPSLLRRPTPDEPLLRGTGPSLVVSVVRPADGAELNRATNFAWRRTAGATAYRVMVSRADGDSVWATTTPDTTVPVSPHLLAAGPGRYYWYVDVLLDDGRSVTGPVHEFRLGP